MTKLPFTETASSGTGRKNIPLNQHFPKQCVKLKHATALPSFAAKKKGCLGFELDPGV